MALAGGVYEQGKIYGLAGNIKGQSASFIDVGIGVGIDGGAGLNVTEYYFVNLTDKRCTFTMDDFAGQRFAVNADASIGLLSLGLPLLQLEVIGIVESTIISRTYSYGLGIEGPPLNGNITMVKQHYPSPSDDEKNMMPFVKFMGLGLIVMIGIIFLFNYIRFEEYPKLLFEHSLNDYVQSVDTDRGSSFVIFETKKYQIDWGRI